MVKEKWRIWRKQGQAALKVWRDRFGVGWSCWDGLWCCEELGGVLLISEDDQSAAQRLRESKGTDIFKFFYPSLVIISPHVAPFTKFDNNCPVVDIVSPRAWSFFFSWFRLGKEVASSVANVLPHVFSQPTYGSSPFLSGRDEFSCHSTTMWWRRSRSVLSLLLFFWHP